ncbi:dihydrolipoyl dehydrogenase LpdA (plasmid) [Phaeobacter gallaeciensis]|uniref:Dihydrolipoyl dehydrogenase LpdA n=1 Tax=Phaeobacter gallaeciensis TaxID=60890 RepID=A0AAC9ZD28_9RHOB|nr:mercuric reductase [Phaeobacter gallaeciensis]ATF04050.1 dihydrolipoyl dehydrogenase LpdA [Phaeobacter gallaeciensis]ATF08326.1 dihydrolipoyl dehydrogenase LpdA [Phaeobacter gallaeciensis]
MTTHYDNIIIGSGQAAPSLAVSLAGRGETVALVEGHELGGSCVNAGCTPTKTLRKTARVAHIARRAADFGVQTGDVTVDFGAAMDRMRDRVATARRELTAWLKRTKGVDIITGWGAFDGRDGDKFVVNVGDTRLTADKVFINTGTSAFTPPVRGLETVPHLDNVGLLALTELPRHLIIVGGSYIGLEMGQIFRRLGSEVTIINSAPRLATREDADVSRIIQTLFDDEGTTIVNDATIAKVEPSRNGVTLILTDGHSFEGSHLLFATGRTANSDRLNLGSVGVETDERGFIPTNPLLETNVAGIWALGDINGRGAFTHTSYHDHEIVLANSNKDAGPLHQWKDADQRTITYAMYTDPPLGRIGMSLADAQKAANDGRNILTADMAMSDVSRAKEEGEVIGLIRLIVDGETEQFLGATVFGFAGDEIIAVLSNYMATGASYRYMQQALPVHPTVAELLPTILGNLKPLAAR